MTEYEKELRLRYGDGIIDKWVEKIEAKKKVDQDYINNGDIIQADINYVPCGKCRTLYSMCPCDEKIKLKILATEQLKNEIDLYKSLIKYGHVEIFKEAIENSAKRIKELQSKI